MSIIATKRNGIIVGQKLLGNVKNYVIRGKRNDHAFVNVKSVLLYNSIITL